MMGCCFTMLFSNVSELSMTQSSDSGLDSSELEFNVIHKCFGETVVARGSCAVLYFAPTPL